jgi:hypothetical protein
LSRVFWSWFLPWFWRQCCRHRGKPWQAFKRCRAKAQERNRARPYSFLATLPCAVKSSAKSARDADSCDLAMNVPRIRRAARNMVPNDHFSVALVQLEGERLARLAQDPTTHAHGIGPI